MNADNFERLMRDYFTAARVRHQVALRNVRWKMVSALAAGTLLGIYLGAWLT